jgi:hypothetical protein
MLEWEITPLALRGVGYSHFNIRSTQEIKTREKQNIKYLLCKLRLEHQLNQLLLR